MRTNSTRRRSGKTILNYLPYERDALIDDFGRRLHNAMRALISMDPHWLIFVEKEIPRDIAIEAATRLVEIRARTLLLRRYNFFGSQNIGHLIFREWPFNDRGNLDGG